MKSETTNCESCGMPVEAGPYCQYCVDEHGNLQVFEERLERLSQWIRRTGPDELSQSEAETKALQYMATMPAWRHHPKLSVRRTGPE
jgi:hypothetical protein